MDLSGLVVILLTAGVLVLLMLEKASLDAIGIGLLVALVATGILTFEEAARGFSNYAVLTLAGLYVIGEGLTRTGAIDFVARAVLRYSQGGERRLVFLMCLIAAVISSILNNTGVLVVLIPVVVGLSQSTGIAASRLLMPLSFAAILGGMCTLVGTSTNLLVSGVAANAGQAPLAMFEITPIGVPIALAGITFMALFAPKILASRKSLSAMFVEAKPREYVTELVIGPTSPLIDQRYSEAFEEGKAFLLFYVRDEQMRVPPYETDKIEPGDVVMLRGGVEDLAELQSRLGLKLIHDLKIAPHEMRFFELAVSPRSTVIGHRVGELRLFRDYGVVTVAVLRAGHHIRERASSLILRPGDLLLVCGDWSVERRLSASSDFFLLTTSQPRSMLRGHARRALAIAGLVVLFFALKSLPELGFLPDDLQPHNLVPIPLAALLGAVLMVASRCVTARRAYRAIDWPILIFVIGTLALGEAMDKTGVAALVAGYILDVLAGLGPAAVVCGLLFLCIVFNAVVSHAAVAVLLTPIAIAAAQGMAAAQGLSLADPGAQALLRAFILSIAIGGSICFATPIGHQTNLMVYAPGGYRYFDFARLGVPLSLLAWVIASLIIPLATGIL
jgi:di/tricarboxylate transporter